MALAVTCVATTTRSADATVAPDRASIAQAWVATRPPSLHVGPFDGFVAHAPITSVGWSYVPYDRTYQGLPVIGGDFVVVIDPSGRVKAASVAQPRPITGIVVPARVGGSDANLVVYARSGTPRLARESVNAADATTTYAEVATGQVLERRTGIMYGRGYSGHNGPNPLSIPTKHVHFSIYDRYYLIDPSGNGITCGDISVGQPFMQTVDTWGNADENNLVTACVNAMFAQQTMARMLSQWLGRNGIDGTGHGFPMWVGLDDVRAYWNTAGHYAKFGHETDGRWVASLDIVGHELGHAVDQFTPGGSSQNGTPEFIADVFGVANEWFANEPAGFDTPDFLIGDGYPHFEVALWTTPYWIPHCYHPGIETAEPHDAAAVGQRWFYLLAEGTNPTDGQPASSTCTTTTTLLGIGLLPALRILYHAMLMKTSNSSYLTYRLWTLRAAYNLYGCTGEFVNKVKSAWSAVLVPPQPAEPLCGIG